MFKKEISLEPCGGIKESRLLLRGKLEVSHPLKVRSIAYPKLVLTMFPRSPFLLLTAKRPFFVSGGILPRMTSG